MFIFKKVRRFSGLFLALAMLNLNACQADANAQQQVQGEENPAQPSPPSARSIKLALILDTSNSMDGLIDQAKAQLWNIVNELALAKCDGLKPDLNIALYQYGNSRLPESEGYIQLVTPLTDDLDEISESLFALSTQGGSEFCGQVIQTSLQELDWLRAEDDFKVIFIAGNEPFTQGRVDYRDACRNAAGKGVIVNTIHCGDFQQGIRESWKDGADLAGGKYMAIDQNSKTEYIPSPYDDDIANLNTKLNKTYLHYGSQGNARRQKMVEQDENSKEYGSANVVKRALTKSSHVYKTKSWDLVEAAKDSTFSITDVEEEYLPQEMKDMDTQQRKVYVAQKDAEREQIKAKIVELNRKREAHVARVREEKNIKNELNDAILAAVREQAQANNFVFEESL